MHAPDRAGAAGRILSAAVLLCLSGCQSAFPADYTTVRLTDGTTLRGELVAADGARQTVDFVEAPDWSMNIMGVPVGPDGKRWQLATRDVDAIEHVPPYIVPLNWALAGFGAALAIGGGIWIANDPDTTEDAIGAMTLTLLGSGLALAGSIFALHAHLYAAESESLWNEANGGAPPAPQPAGSGAQVGLSVRFDGP